MGYLGGESLVPIMRDPEHGTTVKNIALSQMGRCWQNNTHYQDVKGHHGQPGDEHNHTNSWESMSDCHWVEREYIDFMGYRIGQAICLSPNGSMGWQKPTSKLEGTSWNGTVH